MSLTYNPNDVFIVQRNADSSSFVERVLTSAPSSLLFFDSASNVVSLSTSSFTASQAVSSSWANASTTAITASWAENSVSSSLYVTTESFASSSWASSSLSASWAYQAVNSLSASSLSASILKLENNGSELVLDNTSNIADRNFSLGYNNSVIGNGNDDSFVVGNNNTSSNWVGGVIGNFNLLTTGEDTYIFGQNNRGGNSDLVIGKGNNSETVEGSGRILIGNSNVSQTGSGANIVVGISNTANVDAASIFGSGITNTSASSVQVGPSNTSKLHIGLTSVVATTPITASSFLGTASWANNSTTASFANNFITTGLTTTMSFANGSSGSATNNQDNVVHISNGLIVSWQVNPF